MAKQRKVLVVDDESYTRDFFRNLLGEDGYLVETMDNGTSAVKRYGEDVIDLVILDLKMPRLNGIEILKRLREKRNDVPVIMITGYGTIESAVEAMKLGAFDYLQKPFENLEEVKVVIKKAIDQRALFEENRFLKEQLSSKLKKESIIGDSPKMQEVFRIVKKVAPLDSTILIVGESGTGKELIASTIHQNSSRRDRRFVAVNCGGLPENLLESTLFGHEKGAFTGAYKTTKGYFEEADDGTLFLDEIGETSPSLQVRLLRVLQDQTFQRVGGSQTIESDVRIITATSKDLQKEVEAGRFREDLYYRINVITIELPSLKERDGDIMLLANFFLKKYNEEFRKRINKFSEGATKRLKQYVWKGNVRELENVVERAVALEEEDEITVNSLPEHILNGYAGENILPTDLTFSEAKMNFEKQYLEKSLQRSGGNITEAAIRTGIPRQNFHLKLKKYNIRPKDFKE